MRPTSGARYVVGIKRMNNLRPWGERGVVAGAGQRVLSSVARALGDALPTRSLEGWLLTEHHAIRGTRAGVSGGGPFGELRGRGRPGDRCPPGSGWPIPGPAHVVTPTTPEGALPCHREERPPEEHKSLSACSCLGRRCSRRR